MTEITLFELHFHDGFDFSPSSVVGGGVEGEDTEAEQTEESGSEMDAASGEAGFESESGRAVGALVGVGILVLLGVAVRKLMADDLDPIEELEDLDEEIEA